MVPHSDPIHGRNPFFVSYHSSRYARNNNKNKKINDMKVCFCCVFITSVVLLQHTLLVLSKRKQGRTVTGFKQKQHQLAQPLAQSLDIYTGISFVHERFQDLLKRSPTTPGFQRTLNDERLANFTEKIQGHTKLLQANDTSAALGKPVPYLGILSIAVLDNKYFIVDGQHRFQALSDYYDTMKTDFNISYILRHFQHSSDIKRYFKEINDVLMIDPSIFSPARETVLKYLRSAYPVHESKSSKPHFPNVNFDQLFKYILERFGYEEEDESAKIISTIEDLNADISQALIVDNVEKYQKSFKTDKQGKVTMFTLAHVVHSTDSKRRRDRMPAVLRRRVWTDQFGDNDIGYCNCCAIKVTTSDFHAGHIIAVAKGGSDDISNLKVICAECNLSMGTRNLIDFSRRYFASRIAALPVHLDYSITSTTAIVMR